MKNTYFRNFSQVCICTLWVTSFPELSQGVCLKYDELGCIFSTSKTHQQIHLPESSVGLLSSAAVVTGLLAFSNSVLNMGKSHFLD